MNILKPVLVGAGILAMTLTHGCGTNRPTPSFNADNPERINSPIAVCGAGFDYELGARLAAEWQKAGGQLTAGFQEFVRSSIFNRTDISSSDKQLMYQNYINCVLEIDRRQRESAGTCEGRCSSILSSCRNKTQRAFARCIGEAQELCIDECVKKYRYSHDSCRLDYCDPNAPTNITRWTQIRCSDEREEIGYCDDSFQNCLSNC